MDILFYLRNLIENQQMGDIGGFCLAWCIWFIEIYLTNKLTPKILVEKVLAKMRKDNIKIVDYIRDYANHLHQFYIQFLLDNNFNKKNIYQIEFNFNQIQHIQNAIIKSL
jgi:hypothetical protein